MAAVALDELSQTGLHTAATAPDTEQSALPAMTAHGPEAEGVAAGPEQRRAAALGLLECMLQAGGVGPIICHVQWLAPKPGLNSREHAYSLLWGCGTCFKDNWDL